MRDSWTEALRVVRIEEGGNDDDPNDHGGRTSRGITEREWDHDREAGEPEDVWQASDAAIDRSYFNRFWLPDCDGMPAGLDLPFFLFNVNAGHVQATRELQRALGVPVDGVLGLTTRTAIATAADVPALVHAFCDRQRAFYRNLAQFPRYGHGWLNRVDHAEAAGQHLAGVAHDLEAHAARARVRIDDVADRPDITASARANPADLKEPTVSPEKSVVVTAGIGIAEKTLEQLHDTLAPLAAYVQTAQTALVIIGCISAALALYGLWKRNQVRALA